MVLTQNTHFKRGEVTVSLSHHSHISLICQNRDRKNTLSKHWNPISAVERLEGSRLKDCYFTVPLLLFVEVAGKVRVSVTSSRQILTVYFTESPTMSDLQT